MTTLLILLVLNSILGYIAGIAGLYFWKITDGLWDYNYAQLKKEPKGIRVICYVIWPFTLCDMKYKFWSKINDFVCCDDGNNKIYPFISELKKENYLGLMIILGITPKIFSSLAFLLVFVPIVAAIVLWKFLKMAYTIISFSINLLGKIFQPKCVK